MGPPDFKSALKGILERLDSVDSPVPTERAGVKALAFPAAIVKEFRQRFVKEFSRTVAGGEKKPHINLGRYKSGEGLKAESDGGHGIEEIALERLRKAIQNPEAIAEVVEGMKATKLKSLFLQKTSIGDKGLSSLARAFGVHNVASLLHLDLSDNGITERGFEELVRALASGALSGLVAINLAHNHIRDGGSNMLARILHIGRLPSLEHLNLSHCYIGDDGVRNIADAMRWAPNSGWNLRTLDLSANVFTEEGVTTLGKALGMGKVPYFRHLNLSFNMVGEVGTRALADLLNSGQVPGVTHLLLSRCHLGEGVAPLLQAVERGNLPYLRVLDVSYNFLGGKGSAALARAMRSGRVPKLRKLVVAQCSIDAHGVELIAEAFDIGRVWGLRYLDLSNNYAPIDSRPADWDDFSPSFARRSEFQRNQYYTSVRRDIASGSLASLMKAGHMAGLEYLDLSKTGMTDDGLIALADEMEDGRVRKLRQFLLRDNDIRSERAMKALAKALVSGNLSELEELDLGHNRGGADVTMALAVALEETDGLEFPSPMVKELRQRLWNSKGSLEITLRQLLRFVEARLGLKLKNMPSPGTVLKNIFKRPQQTSRLLPTAAVPDEESRRLESVGFDRKRFFNVMLVVIWLSAVVVSKIW